MEARGIPVGQASILVLGFTEAWIVRTAGFHWNTPSARSSCRPELMPQAVFTHVCREGETCQSSLHFDAYFACIWKFKHRSRAALMYHPVFLKAVCFWSSPGKTSSSSTTITEGYSWKGWCGSKELSSDYVLFSLAIQLRSLFWLLSYLNGSRESQRRCIGSQCLTELLCTFRKGREILGAAFFTGVR